MSVFREIEIINPVALAGDTLLGYRVKSDRDGVVGFLSKTEQEEGKNAFIEISSNQHQLTIVPLGQSNGEYTNMASDAISLDVTNENYQWDNVNFLLDDVGSYRNSQQDCYAQGKVPASGAFELSIDCYSPLAVESYIDDSIIGITLSDNNVKENGWLIYVRGIGGNAIAFLNNVNQSIDNPTLIEQKPYDELVIKRDNNDNVMLIYRQKGLADIVVHDFGQHSGNAYPHFSTRINGYSARVVNPIFKML